VSRALDVLVRRAQGIRCLQDENHLIYLAPATDLQYEAERSAIDGEVRLVDVSLELLHRYLVETRKDYDGMLDFRTWDPAPSLAAAKDMVCEWVFDRAHEAGSDYQFTAAVFDLDEGREVNFTIVETITFQYPTQETR
jgi:hypothetical protein